MHYLDHVFYIQFPFYNPIEEERGWLFSLLTRHVSVYHATLALSQYHWRSTANARDDSINQGACQSQTANITYWLFRSCRSYRHAHNGVEQRLDHGIHALTCSFHYYFSRYGMYYV